LGVYATGYLAFIKLGGGIGDRKVEQVIISKKKKKRGKKIDGKLGNAEKKEGIKTERRGRKLKRQYKLGK